MLTNFVNICLHNRRAWKHSWNLLCHISTISSHCCKINIAIVEITLCSVAWRIYSLHINLSVKPIQGCQVWLLCTNLATFLGRWQQKKSLSYFFGYFLVPRLEAKWSISGDAAATVIQICGAKTWWPRRFQLPNLNLALKLHKIKNALGYVAGTGGDCRMGPPLADHLLLNMTLNRNGKRTGQWKAFGIQLGALHSWTWEIGYPKNCMPFLEVTYGLQLRNINCSDFVIAREMIAKVTAIYTSIEPTLILSALLLYPFLLSLEAVTSSSFLKRNHKRPVKRVPFLK